MRKYFENVSGLATGTDLGVKHTPHRALQFGGLKGEGISDARAFIKKSHYPFTFPFQKECEHDIAVICARYELDCDVSFFYQVYTQTHGLNFNNKLTEEPLKPFWVDF